MAEIIAKNTNTKDRALLGDVPWARFNPAALTLPPRGIKGYSPKTALTKAWSTFDNAGWMIAWYVHTQLNLSLNEYAHKLGVQRSSLVALMACGYSERSDNVIHAVCREMDSNPATAMLRESNADFADEVARALAERSSKGIIALFDACCLRHGKDFVSQCLNISPAAIRNRLLAFTHLNPRELIRLYVATQKIAPTLRPLELWSNPVVVKMREGMFENIDVSSDPVSKFLRFVIELNELSEDCLEGRFSLEHKALVKGQSLLPERSLLLFQQLKDADYIPSTERLPESKENTGYLVEQVTAAARARAILLRISADPRVVARYLFGQRGSRKFVSRTKIFLETGDVSGAFPLARALLFDASSHATLTTAIPSLVAPSHSAKGGEGHTVRQLRTLWGISREELSSGSTSLLRDFERGKGAKGDVTALYLPRCDNAAAQLARDILKRFLAERLFDSPQRTLSHLFEAVGGITNARQRVGLQGGRLIDFEHGAFISLPRYKQFFAIADRRCTLFHEARWRFDIADRIYVKEGKTDASIRRAALKVLFLEQDTSAKELARHHHLAPKTWANAFRAALEGHADEQQIIYLTGLLNTNQHPLRVKFLTALFSGNSPSVIVREVISQGMHSELWKVFNFNKLLAIPKPHLHALLTQQGVKGLALDDLFSLKELYFLDEEITPIKYGKIPEVSFAHLAALMPGVPREMCVQALLKLRIT